MLIKSHAFSSLNIYLARSNSFDQVSNYLATYLTFQHLSHSSVKVQHAGRNIFLNSGRKTKLATWQLSYNTNTFTNIA